MALFSMKMKALVKVETMLVDESNKQGYNRKQHFEAAL
jgi:hypothetical protein